MIRIGTIQEMDDTDTEHSALYLQETGGTRDELHEGDTVSQAHIAGVAPQTVQIHESPEAPTWTTDTTHLKLPLSGEFHFSEEIFTHRHQHSPCARLHPHRITDRRQYGSGRRRAHPGTAQG